MCNVGTCALCRGHDSSSHLSSLHFSSSMFMSIDGSGKKKKKNAKEERGVRDGEGPENSSCVMPAEVAQKGGPTQTKNSIKLRPAYFAQGSKPMVTATVALCSYAGSYFDQALVANNECVLSSYLVFCTGVHDILLRNSPEYHWYIN